MRKIHPDCSVSAFSDASVFRILSSVHGVGIVFHFLALCLVLSTAPQVFMRVMAPVWSFFYTVLVSASAFTARLSPSGVLTEIVFFLQGRSSGCATLLTWSSIGRCLSLWRISNHFSLGVLLASQFSGFSSPVKIQQASFNGPPVFRHMWVYLHLF